MGETVGQIVPHPLRLQIHRDDMSFPREVLKGITVLIPSASDATADHADPVVFARSAEGTDSRLASIEIQACLAGQRGTVFAQLQEDPSGNTSEIVLETLKAVQTAGELDPSLLLHESVDVEGGLQVWISKCEAMSVTILGGRQQSKCGFSEVKG